MSETAQKRFILWQRMRERFGVRWGIGVAVDILAIEARLAALEQSSRPVQSAPETAAAVANDPERECEPVDPIVAAGERLRKSLSKDAATEGTSQADDVWLHQAREIAAQCWCDETTRHVEMVPELAEVMAHKIAAWIETAALHAKNEAYWRERAERAPSDSLPDDAGRRLVAGEPMTVMEMQHALGVARQEIVWMTAERDVAIRERDELKRSWLSAIDHATRLMSRRDEALAEVERHRMTREEREAICCASWPFGVHNLMNPRRQAYLDRTKEGE